MAKDKYTVGIKEAGPYHFGDLVHVTTDVPADLRPWIEMECKNNGEVIGTASHAGFPGGSYYGQPFQLGPSLSWEGGPADDCRFYVVHLKGGHQVNDCEVHFEVLV